MISISIWFQSSFELTGYITNQPMGGYGMAPQFQSSFELTGYITVQVDMLGDPGKIVSKLFRAYGLYNKITYVLLLFQLRGFKALSSLRVI